MLNHGACVIPNFSSNYWSQNEKKNPHSHLFQKLGHHTILYAHFMTVCILICMYSICKKPKDFGYVVIPKTDYKIKPLKNNHFQRTYFQVDI